MMLKQEWQLVVPKGHGIFKNVTTIHTFDDRGKALAFLADYVAGPAIKAGDMPPEADLRCVIRHEHGHEDGQRFAMVRAALVDIVRMYDDAPDDDVCEEIREARRVLKEYGGEYTAAPTPLAGDAEKETNG